MPNSRPPGTSPLSNSPRWCGGCGAKPRAALTPTASPSLHRAAEEAPDDLRRVEIARHLAEEWRELEMRIGHDVPATLDDEDDDRLHSRLVPIQDLDRGRIGWVAMRQRVGLGLADISREHRPIGRGLLGRHDHAAAAELAEIDLATLERIDRIAGAVHQQHRDRLVLVA